MAESQTQSGILRGRGWLGRAAAFPAAAAASAISRTTVPILEDITAEDCTGPVARVGEMIIVQERYDSVTHLVLSTGGVLHNRYGRFLHSDVIGKPLGLRWEASDIANYSGRHGPKAQSSKGFIYALAPTPALWSMAMYHRTQVVYPSDSAVISLYLDLRPGSILVESGTGAGSASVAFARTVAPHGRVMTFEFHKDRAEAARVEFENLGLSDIICVHPGHDVLSMGFSTVADGYADAVFLDLPAPYDVIAEAARVLRPDGTLCSFSPCIEQVQRTCEKLRAGPFHSVRTVTAPTRTYETRVDSLNAPGFDEISSSMLATRYSMAANREENATLNVSKGTTADDAIMETLGKDEAFTTVQRKRVGCRTAASERTAIQNAAMKSAALKGRRVDADKLDETSSCGFVGRVLRPTVPVKSRPFPEMKGHTSYLTFARRTKEDWRTMTANGVAARGQNDTFNCNIV